MQVVKSLESLDLSRNSITSIPPGTFRDQSALKYLDLSLNSLRTVRILNMGKASIILNCAGLHCFYRSRMMPWRVWTVFKPSSSRITTFYSYQAAPWVVCRS